MSIRSRTTFLGLLESSLFTAQGHVVTTRGGLHVVLGLEHLQMLVVPPEQREQIQIGRDDDAAGGAGDFGHHRTRGFDDADTEVAELTGVHGSRRISERAHPLLGLGERDDLSDRFLAHQAGGKAVEAEGDAPHGRSAELEGLEQESEARPGLFLGDAEKTEEALLHRRLMDADGASGRLLAVEHEIVGLGRARPGSDSRRARSSSRGAVKGWWTASQRFSSAFHSTRGKSITHVKTSRSSGMSLKRLARSTRSRPRTVAATAGHRRRGG
jgi:hypothetical protein